MKILFSYGTRPEYIKIKPLLTRLKGTIPFEVLYTGQQKDIAGTEYTLRQSVENGCNRLDSIVRSVLNDNWIFNGITHVIAQGDTTSALAIALAAYHRGIKIIHLEAGLRTYEKEPFPEEGNRRMIDAISDIYLCPTEQNAKQLKAEGCDDRMIFVIGNTGLDDLETYKVTKEDHVIVTMHRRENHQIMAEWFMAIEDLASETALQFIIPIHPNPDVYKHREIFKKVQVIEPMTHDEMISKIASCSMIVSDSGGIQEEAAYFGKKIIVCRGATERLETLGIYSFICPKPEYLKETFIRAMNSRVPNETYCPYGDGKASERIIQILKSIQ